MWFIGSLCLFSRIMDGLLDELHTDWFTDSLFMKCLFWACCDSKPVWSCGHCVYCNFIWMYDRWFCFSPVCDVRSQEAGSCGSLADWILCWLDVWWWWRRRKIFQQRPAAGVGLAACCRNIGETAETTRTATGQNRPHTHTRMSHWLHTCVTLWLKLMLQLFLHVHVLWPL